jgi:hypothetical protein
MSRAFRRRRRLTRGEAFAPERSKDLEWRAIRGTDVPGLEEEAAIKALGQNSRITQRGFDRRIAGHGGGLVAAIPVNGGCACFANKCMQSGEGWPAAQNEPIPPLLQFLFETPERVVQPPPAGASDRPVTVFVGGEDKDRDDRPSAIDCRLKGRVVVNPQVVAQPDKGSPRCHDDLEE